MPATILFISANPSDTSELELGEEYRAIADEKARARLRDAFDLRPMLAARVEDFRRGMTEHGPAVVHFSGHAERAGGTAAPHGRELTPAPWPAGDPHDPSPGELVVMNDVGRAVPVPVEAMAELFRLLGAPTRTVVLNACHTLGLAEAITRHVDCVIGTTGAIPDEVAIEFARGFYAALFMGKSVRDAFDLGKNEVRAKNVGDPEILVLRCRAGVKPGAVYPALASDPLPAIGSLPSRRLLIAATAAVVSVLLSVVLWKVFRNDAPPSNDGPPSSGVSRPADKLPSGATGAAGRRPEAPPASAPPLGTPPVAEADTGRCPPGMSEIPGGPFLLRQGEYHDPADVPVVVQSFCLDRTEVTVERYAQCVGPGHCTAPRATDGCTFQQSNARQHPVNCVDWQQADTNCKFQKKRLPTHEEWEYAARGGTEYRVYPWGAGVPTRDRLNGCGAECDDTDNVFKGTDGWEQTAPVMSFPDGKGRWDLHDLAGNVAEWSATQYCRAPGESDPQCVENDRVLRGSSYNTKSVDWIRSAHYTNNKQSVWTPALGFRCAKTLPGTR